MSETNNNEYQWQGEPIYTETQEEMPQEKKKERKPHKKITKVIAWALVFGLVAGSSFEGSRYLVQKVTKTNTSTVKLEPTISKVAGAEIPNGGSTGMNDVSGIVEQVMPSIVAITNMSEVQYNSFFGQSQKVQNQSAGSGIIMSQDDTYLYVATNNHVVSNAKVLTVQFVDDKSVEAEVKGTLASSDLAVLAVPVSKIEKDTLSKIKVATIGDSDKLKVGQGAIAIGNALGYGQSVTSGIISALNREVTVKDEKTQTAYTNKLIQTNAAINPGNSGGALLNAAGEVIGINSVKSLSVEVEGMGYAIPINTAASLIEKLINKETVTENSGAFLGIQSVDVVKGNSYNMPEGAYVYKLVEGAAAEKAGIAQGDIITSINDITITNGSALQEQISLYKPGDEITVKLQRLNNGKYEEKEIKVELGKKQE